MPIAAIIIVKEKQLWSAYNNCTSTGLLGYSHACVFSTEVIVSHSFTFSCSELSFYTSHHSLSEMEFSSGRRFHVYKRIAEIYG